MDRHFPHLTVILAIALTFAPLGAQPGPGKAAFPSGKEAAARMTVPPGFVVKCFASEPDVVNPIAIDFDPRGRVYVLEALQYPIKGPASKPGPDRIRIYEDVDGDGVADKVTLFAEGLNLASGLAVGFGGVFVGQAPELLFLEDTDGDGKADKRTVLLDGWGHQDTHETLNSFLWGPDGWLYGCHGVFTHSRVGKPGTPDAERVPINAGIWRYHPSTWQFEVFGEGTSNPWGYDFDENGSGFLTACVIPHLFHVFPGGRYVRQAGQNFNPYLYGQVREICDHVHYFGGSSHEGNQDPRRFEVGGGHAHAGCLVYQGGAFPQKWNGRVFMHNLHGGRINTDVLKQNGATYVGSHGEDFLVANDPNFRIIQLRTGPDGSVFMIDWYDPQICHNTDAAIWDRSHGRVYKVEYKGNPGNGAEGQTAAPPSDLSQAASSELVELLKHPNSWVWRKALLLLQERGDRSVLPQLKEMLASAPDHRHALRALWGINNLGAFDDAAALQALAHANPWVQSWGVRLVGQLPAPPGNKVINRIAALARSSPHPEVLLQIAAACQSPRCLAPLGLSTGLLPTLAARDEFARDPVLPLMIWFAFEPFIVPEIEVVQEYLTGEAAKHVIARETILPRVMRRLTAANDPKYLDVALALMSRLGDDQGVVLAADGLLEGLRGRRLTAPPSWDAARGRLMRSSAGPLADRGVRLGVHFGDAAAVRRQEEAAASPKTDPGRRIEAIRGLALARRESSLETLIALVIGDGPHEVRREALRALASFDSGTIPAALTAGWPQLNPELRREALGVLAGRKPWAMALLAQVKAGKIERTDLTENHVRQVMALNDPGVTKELESTWGKLRAQTPQKLEEQLARFREQLRFHPGDRAAGKAVFEKNCQVCHKLFGAGYNVGPDITGANRRDPEYLLTNVLDPNRVVGKDYYRAVVLDASGRLHTGLLAEDAPQRVVVKGENEKLTVIPRSEVDQFRIEELSLMPEGLPDTMTEQQFRDLIAYVMEDPYLHRGLVTGPFKMALDATAAIEERAGDPLKTPGLAWKPFALGPTALIDMDRLGVLAPPTDSTAYVYFEVKSPKEMATHLEIAADEDACVWLNGKEVHRRKRAMEPARVAIQLKPGVNRLLVKVHNIYGASWLWSRIGDPERVLEILPVPAP